jgi:periplasmic protein TonB
MPRHGGWGNVGGASERTKITGLHTGRVRLRRGFGLAIALHMAAVFGLALVHPVLRPDADVAAYDVVVMTAEPPSALAEPPQNESLPEPITSPDQQPAPTTDTPAIQPPPQEAPQQAVAEPESPPPPPAPVADLKPPPEPVILEPAPPPQLPPPSTLRPPVLAQRPSHVPAARHEAASTGKPNAAPVLDPKAGEPKAAALPPAAPQPQPQAERPSPAWLAGVDKWLLDHRFYPETARRQGREGTVVVRFTADHDGHVLAVTLVRGSGSEALDEAAQVLLRGARLPPFPSDMTMAQQSVAVSIRYRLN